MKKLSNLFVIALVALAFTLSNCSKSGDPAPVTPAQKTALDSVKNAMVGTWKFTSMAVMQISTGKSASTTTCAKSELKAAGVFTNTNWMPLTPEFDYIYKTDGTASESNDCVTATAPIKYTLTKNSDGSVNIAFSDPNNNSAYATYQVEAKQTTSSIITATLISDGNSVASTLGYKVVFKFTKQ